MATKIYKKKLDKNGVTLVYVVLVMLVMSLLGVAVFTLFSANLSTAKAQRDSIKAHFLAVSGVEMGFAAVLDTESTGTRLLDTYFKANDITSVMGALEDEIELDEGVVIIKISSYIDDEERFIKIESTGVPNDLGNSKTLTMHFSAKFPELQRWD